MQHAHLVLAVVCRGWGRKIGPKEGLRERSGQRAPRVFEGELGSADEQRRKAVTRRAAQAGLPNKAGAARQSGGGRLPIATTALACAAQPVESGGKRRARGGEKRAGHKGAPRGFSFFRLALSSSAGWPVLMRSLAEEYHRNAITRWRGQG